MLALASGASGHARSAPDAPHRMLQWYCSYVRWVQSDTLTAPDAQRQRPVHRLVLLWALFQLSTTSDFDPTKFHLQKHTSKHQMELVRVTSLKPSNFHKYLAIGLVVFMKIVWENHQGASYCHKARGLNHNELWMLPLSMDEHSGCSTNNRKETVNKQACIWYELKCNTWK